MSTPGTRFTLVVLETAHIQEYIFNSNRLKENVGASYLVSAATEAWVRDLIWESDHHHNLANDGFTEARLERDGIDVEVLYCGGGNAVLLFRYRADALTFIGELSLKAMQFAPGLRLTFHHVADIEWDHAVLSHEVSEALKTLRQQRSQQSANLGLYGLGVTAMCASTSLPAVTMDRDPDGNWEAISAEIDAKRKAADKEANSALETLIYHVTSATTRERLSAYRFALELDDLGRTKGESSYIAVVHADGNGMGQIIQGLKDEFSTPDANRAYIDRMRWFSENVKKAAQAALGQMIDLLVESIDERTQTIRGVHGQADIKLKAKNGYVLPIRPLVSGGDDITFVCDGRIGLDMAVRFLEAFEQATEAHLEKRLTACAGVAIVNAHYPFARAYDLAGDLCDSAKKEHYWIEQTLGGQKSASQSQYSLIDWHYTPGGLYGELENMREREYEVQDGLLCVRPLVISDHTIESYRTWATAQRIATEFQINWREHRSKTKQFMTVLRGGPAEADAFLHRSLAGTEVKLPAIPGIQGDPTWDNQRCLYYDALELMDLYIPITQEAQTHVS